MQVTFWCNFSPGPAFKEDFSSAQPRVDFVRGKLETLEPVLELYLTCVCASVMNGVEVYSGANRNDLGD